MSPMPEIAADSFLPRCSLLLSKVGMKRFQSLGPDPSLPRARERA
jgi:hypothetical protein